MWLVSSTEIYGPNDLAKLSALAASFFFWVADHQQNSSSYYNSGLAWWLVVLRQLSRPRKQIAESFSEYSPCNLGPPRPLL